jgi:hypothetical protein
MTTRPLADALEDLARALTPLPTSGLRVTELEASVPFDVGIARRSDGVVEVSGEIPSWRWRTAFDHEPGRLTIAFVHVVTPSGGLP